MKQVNGMKVCSKCKETKPVSSFGRSSRLPDGLRCHCKECVSASSRAYHWKHQAKQNAQSRRYNATHKAGRSAYNAVRYRERPERAKARKAVAQALKRGDIMKPSACVVCGAIDSPLRGHHHNGYTGVNAVDVLWVCLLCHKQLHREMNRNEEQRSYAVA